MTLSLRSSGRTGKDKVMPESSTAAGGAPFPRVPDLIFTNWREALHNSGLSSGVQTVYGMAVGGYVEYCSRNAISVTSASARAYIADVVRRGLAKHPELWKDGLNWFFKEGRRHCATLTATGLPTIGQADTGSQPWERRMIERLRLQHYAWRTEKTYREWAWRLADFMRPRDVEGATGEDVRQMQHETNYTNSHEEEAEGKQASPQKATKFTKSWPSGKKTTNSDKSRTGLSLMLATADTARNELHEFTRRGGGGGEETGHRHKRPQSSQSPRRWRKGNRHRHKRQQSSKSPVIYRFSQLFTSPGTTRNNGWGFGIETFRNRSATCGARR